MKPKFEIGNRVIYKPSNYVGMICGIDRDLDGYLILYDDGEECFLTRLQELLATFNAKICS